MGITGVAPRQIYFSQIFALEDLLQTPLKLDFRSRFWCLIPTKAWGEVYSIGKRGTASKYPRYWFLFTDLGTENRE
jgi:hypothetical protein